MFGLLQLVAYGPQDFMPNGYYPGCNHQIPVWANKRIKKKQKPSILKEKKFKNFRKYDKYDQRQCCICLDKFKLEQFVVIRKCKHIYHKDCHNKKLMNCPICRQ